MRILALLSIVLMLVPLTSCIVTHGNPHPTWHPYWRGNPGSHPGPKHHPDPHPHHPRDALAVPFGIDAELEGTLTE
jgi:hypothetical protein